MIVLKDNQEEARAIRHNLLWMNMSFFNKSLELSMLIYVKYKNIKKNYHIVSLEVYVFFSRSVRILAHKNNWKYHLN